MYAFFAGVLMTGRTIHVIPHVSMVWSKGVDTQIGLG